MEGATGAAALLTRNVALIKNALGWVFIDAVSLVLHSAAFHGPFPSEQMLVCQACLWAVASILGAVHRVRRV